jgi:hypothetical protein
MRIESLMSSWVRILPDHDMNIYIEGIWLLFIFVSAGLDTVVFQGRPHSIPVIRNVLPISATVTVTASE